MLTPADLPRLQALLADAGVDGWLLLLCTVTSNRGLPSLAERMATWTSRWYTWRSTTS